jgi:uncharacterized membrane protein YphA (DoxX/SURF4 family)
MFVSKEAAWANRMFLGLIMLIPGLIKLIGMGPAAITGMLAGLGFPAAGFLAWTLIAAEIGFGLAILLNWKLHLTTYPPMIILGLAAFTMHIASVPLILLHLGAMTNYFFTGRAAVEET